MVKSVSLGSFGEVVDVPSPKSVAEIAQRQNDRISRLIKDKGKHQQAFEKFLKGLQKNINPSITEQEAVDMLSQHIITKPVFEALFQNYSFVRNNPISKSMQTMLDLLEAQAIEKDTGTLHKFYELVRMRAAGINNAEGKQRIIVELYDKFFKTAFPKMVEQLGIVYTPVEVVDFIIHSVNDVLKKEFDRSLSDENIHILDPFTGTGTFITRLLQSGLIDKKDLVRKYKQELHANEIVLLAYYIAAVNIENAFHDAIGEIDYTSFEGICLTDTFQLGETKDGEKLFSDMFPQNSKRVQRQKKAPLKVIIGNPPYSIGQKSANDNAQNQEYIKLDTRVARTYAAASTAGLNKSLYDAYIKAFRWSSDRLDKNGGIICFVSNGAWLDGNSTDGFRSCLENEFSSIYVFNLRGNQRTSGELSRKEGGKIFGSGSRTPIAITLLVKNPAVEKKKATIFYKDIGDYLSREQKLSIIKNFHSIANQKIEWKTLQPNDHGDWISIRNDAFDNYIPLAPEKKFDLRTRTFFNTYSNGVVTSRDAWVYNFSKSVIRTSMQRMISFYNSQREKLAIEIKAKNPKLLELIDANPSMISWSVNLKRDFSQDVKHTYSEKFLSDTLYRPFTKQRIYFDRSFIERPGYNDSFFPTDKKENIAIAITGLGSSKEFSPLVVNSAFDFQTLMNGLAFPLYYYEERQKQGKTLFDEDGDEEHIRRDGISDFILERARKLYGKNVTKEDIFYYIYAFLHNQEYRTMFASDLKKMLPRLSLVDDVKDFWTYSKAGRKLAELHINYESVPAHKSVKVKGANSKFFTVEKMRFPKKDQKDTIVYNSHITIENIPAQAYEYIINGKPAIEWIMERYQVNVHKESGIKSDPNEWAKEEDNPKYILDLLLSVINVSVQTVEIVNSLPKVKI